MFQLSVVIPTYNRIERLKAVLDGLAQQTIDRSQFEVIVVSDGSTDGTAEHFANRPSDLNLRFFQHENQGVAATRNFGWRQSSAPLVLFLDDDVIPAKSLLAAHLETHAAAAQDSVVIGPMLNPDDYRYQPWVAWEQAMLYKQYHAMLAKEWEPTARQFYTGNTSLKRRYLEETGGFDPTFKRAEDIELAYRLDALGLKFLFNMDAAGYHYARRSFDSWLKIPYQYGRNDVLFCLEKEQPWILPIIGREFRGRHPLIRTITHLSLDSQLFYQVLLISCKTAGSLLYQLGLSKLSRGAFSVIFNIRHYQGISDQLGGRSQFFEALNRPVAIPEQYGS